MQSLDVLVDDIQVVDIPRKLAGNDGRISLRMRRQLLGAASGVIDGLGRPATLTQVVFALSQGLGVGAHLLDVGQGCAGRSQ